MSADLELEASAWPLDRMADAMRALAQEAKLPLTSQDAPVVPTRLEGTGSELDRWAEDVADWLGIEAEPFHVLGVELDSVHRAAPALLRLRCSDGSLRLLAVARSTPRRVWMVAPDLRVRTYDNVRLRAALYGGREQPLSEYVEGVLAQLPIPTRRRNAVRDRFVMDGMAGQKSMEGWILRPPASGPLWPLLRRSGTARYAGLVLGAHVTQYALFLLSWYLIGRAAIEGRYAWGWLLAWAAVLVTTVPVRVLSSWCQGQVALRLGGVVKQRLLLGALRVDPEETRRQGIGQLMGRVIESESLEGLALSGGLMAATGCIELVAAAVVLGFGAAGWLHVAVLVLWVALMAWLVRRHYVDRERWTGARLSLTHDLVEQMVGHRTRLVQQPPERWHEGEDLALQSYLGSSRRVDGSASSLASLASRGWLLLGVATLTPAFVLGRSEPVALAIALGGLLLAARALDAVALGFAHLAGAGIAWKEVGPLFEAAARSPERGAAPASALATAGPTGGGRATVLDAKELTFGYPGRGVILRGADFRIQSGDHVLLEGPSGSGKSTLASLLVGLRRPSSGLLLLGGLDMPTLGAMRWRRRSVAVPQFHENHLFAGTLAFNLLMGRSWPATDEELAEAEEVCHALGLGPLLDRMPSGLMQLVGESGWQLSHGERSRVYVARALLQGAELIVLDESFAALDPENVARCMEVVRRRAGTLVVVAHP